MTIICVWLAGPCPLFNIAITFQSSNSGQVVPCIIFYQHGDVIISQKFITCFSWWESHNHFLVWTELTRNKHLLCLLLILISYADINKFCLIRAVDKRSLQLPLCFTMNLYEGFSADMAELICSHFISCDIIEWYLWLSVFFKIIVWLRFYQCNTDIRLI